MNQRENEFNYGFAQFVVPGPSRWRYPTDRSNARLELRSQVRVEVIAFGDHYFISIDAMGMDEITQRKHTEGEEERRKKKPESCGHVLFPTAFLLLIKGVFKLPWLHQKQNISTS